MNPSILIAGGKLMLAGSALEEQEDEMDVKQAR